MISNMMQLKPKYHYRNHSDDSDWPKSGDVWSDLTSDWGDKMWTSGFSCMVAIQSEAWWCVLLPGAVPFLLRAGPGVPGLSGGQIAPAASTASLLKETAWIWDPAAWIFASLVPNILLWLDPLPCLDENIINPTDLKRKLTSCNIPLKTISSSPPDPSRPLPCHVTSAKPEDFNRRADSVFYSLQDLKSASVSCLTLNKHWKKEQQLTPFAGWYFVFVTL